MLGHHQPVQLHLTVLRHRFRIVRRSANGYLGHINILFAEANRKNPTGVNLRGLTKHR